jgi:hypothetical protein
MVFLSCVLLQAAIAAGMLLVIFLVLFAIVGIPIVSGILMKIIWTRVGKEDYVKSKAPYYKTPVIYFIVLIISAVIVFLIFLLLLNIFGVLFPNFLEYS